MLSPGQILVKTGYFNQGGLMDHAMVRRSMTLFARDVLPYCR